MNGSTIFWAAFLRPFVLLILAVCIFWPVKAAMRRYMKDGKLKRLLLTEIGQKTSGRNR